MTRAPELPEQLAVVSLGSNVEPERNLPAAVALLAAGRQLAAASRVYETPPVGPAGGSPFLNAAVAFHTSLSPEEVKWQVLRPIEDRLGRRRGANRFAPRPIDLDLVALGEHPVSLEGRALPDPELALYAHLAIPVAEVAPTLAVGPDQEPVAAVAARLQGRLAAGWRLRDDVRLLP